MSVQLNNDVSIVNYGVSEHLKAEFTMLREVQTAQGSNKFKPQSVDALAQHLVCRNYGNLCYELSHLNWAILNINASANNSSLANHCADKLLDFYWLQDCHNAQQCIRYFQQFLGKKKDLSSNAIDKLNKHTMELVNGAKIELAASVIKLNIHNHSFNLNASRTNLLSCFMEWLVGLVPNLFQELDEKLLASGLNGIKEAASCLQKHIYDYLSLHLPAAKLQQKFRQINEWYTSRAKLKISDQSILEFWRTNNKTEGFAKYNNVLKDSLSYVEALNIVNNSTALSYAISNNAEYTENELESETTYMQIFAQMQGQSSTPRLNIQTLLHSPKALTKQHFDFVVLAASYPNTIVNLVLSWLRSHAFGKYQNQLIQQLRDNSTARTSNMSQHNSVVDASQAACTNYSSYLDIKSESITLIAANQQTLLALSQLLIEEQPHQACLILLKLSKQMPKYQIHYSALESLLNHQANNSDPLTMGVMAKWQLHYPWFKELMQQSKLALKQINRQGFTAKTKLESGNYSQCAEYIFDLNNLLRALIKQVKQEKIQLDSIFASDRLIFDSEFSKLYTQEDK